MHRSHSALEHTAALCLFLVFLVCFLVNVASADQIIYSDSLQNGWANWSWATNSLLNTNPVHGGACSISVTCGPYQALYLENSALDASAYTNLVFWIDGGSTGGQQLQVQATLGGIGKTPYLLAPLATNWEQITISLNSLGVTNPADADGFWIQNTLNTSLPTFYVDDIVLITGPPPPPPPTNFITIDVAANRHLISSDIYGLAYASPYDLASLNCPLNRLGGNNTSRYNWQANADNRAADWYFESIGYPSATAGEVADTFISNTKSASAQPLVTIPMLNWIAKLGTNRSKVSSFSIAKYGPQTGDDVYFPDAGNGVLTGGEYVSGNDPNDANVPADSAYQQSWVQHLTNQWGTAASGGLRYYILDNEPSIWHSTHRDVHPVGATMDEIKNKIIDYASMIKAIDPGALVVGPEEWGWSGYFYSGYDQQAAAANGYTAFPDREAHGGQDYLPWLLSQLYQTNLASGQRLLDIFSVHYYPQGGEFGDDVSTATQLLRNRSTRSLWDTNYVDSSWIDAVVELIPRLKNWVATNYPGTPVAITEYNWGAEGHINGATAQADILGIFGREGLNLATRWTTPASNSPVYNAIRMYRNYDGNQSSFGDTSVSAGGPNPDSIAVFAAQRSSDGALTAMVINKSLSGTMPIVINFTNFHGSGTAQAWQLNSTNIITRLPDLTCSGGTITTALAAPSITLFVIPASSLLLQAGPPRNDGHVDLWLNGETGQSYVVQSSQDLKSWIPVSTNTLIVPQLHLVLAGGVSADLFYRGARQP